LALHKNKTNFEIKGKIFSSEQIIEKMGGLLTAERKERIREVVNKRTLDIIPVLDGIHDLGNVSAVMRSAEAFGLQELHFVENQPKYKISQRTSKGTDKWLNVIRWKESLACAKDLKSRGYKIVATHLDSTAVPISEVDFSQPTALILGNEKEGVSKEILEMSDVRCIIPMQGFAESFNISVAAALSFYHIYQDRMRRLGHHGNLTPEQKNYLIADYYLRTTDNPELYF
jgi:tRNA (guanosine-2'-O-)-methyltransferase